MLRSVPGRLHIMFKCLHERRMRLGADEHNTESRHQVMTKWLNVSWTWSDRNPSNIQKRERESWGICRYHITSGPYQSVARGKLIKPLDLFVFRSCDENVCNKDLCQQTLADDFLDAACLNRLPFFSAELSTCQLTDCLHYIVTTYAKIRM